MFYPFWIWLTKIELNSSEKNNSASTFHEISLKDINDFICYNELPECHAVIQHGNT